MYRILYGRRDLRHRVRRRRSLASPVTCIVRFKSHDHHPCPVPVPECQCTNSGSHITNILSRYAEPSLCLTFVSDTIARGDADPTVAIWPTGAQFGDALLHLELYCASKTLCQYVDRPAVRGGDVQAAVLRAGTGLSSTHHIRRRQAGGGGVIHRSPVLHSVKHSLIDLDTVIAPPRTCGDVLLECPDVGS